MDCDDALMELLNVRKAWKKYVKGEEDLDSLGNELSRISTRLDLEEAHEEARIKALHPEVV